MTQEGPPAHLACMLWARMGSAAKPLAELGGHSHWVWQARFCPAHDCLLLSASSDALVNLWYAPWLGAAAGGSLAAPARAGGPPRGAHRGVLEGSAGAGSPSPSRAGGGPRGGAKEGRVCAFDDHEDSVYSAPLRPLCPGVLTGGWYPCETWAILQTPHKHKVSRPVRSKAQQDSLLRFKHYPKGSDSRLRVCVQRCPALSPHMCVAGMPRSLQCPPRLL